MTEKQFRTIIKNVRLPRADRLFDRSCDWIPVRQAAQALRRARAAERLWEQVAPVELEGCRAVALEDRVLIVAVPDARKLRFAMLARAGILAVLRRLAPGVSVRFELESGQP